MIIEDWYYKYRTVALLVTIFKGIILWDMHIAKTVTIAIAEVMVTKILPVTDAWRETIQTVVVIVTILMGFWF